METIDVKDFINLLNSNSFENKTYYAISGEDCVLVGDGELNSIGLTEYKSHDFGGTIVCFKGDICIANFQDKINNFGYDICNKIMEFIKSKNIDANCIDNDVLIDNKYKVCSFMSCRKGDKYYTAVHISMNIDLELIKQICQKTMIKIPKGLTEYDINSEDLLKFLVDYKE